MKIGMALGGACTSTAWVVTFCMEHNWLFALYNRQAQEEVFGKQPYMIAPGSLAPKGVATPVNGGFRVTGRWEWGTGVMHADWAMVGALTPVEGSDRQDLCMYMLPRDQIEVIDTWNVAGMVATGSNDIAVHDVFIPEHMKESIATIRDGTSAGAKWLDRPLYKMPMLPVLGLTAAAPVVGCAKRAVELFCERMQERVVYGTTDKQSEKGVAQHRLGHIALAAENAEVLLMQLARDVEEWGQTDDPCSEGERAHFRFRIADVVRKSRDVVRDVVEASGAHAHFLSSPLQRMLRDVHTASCHTVFDCDLAGEQHGRAQLGLPLTIPV